MISLWNANYALKFLKENNIHIQHRLHECMENVNICELSDTELSEPWRFEEAVFSRSEFSRR